jgi:hypothetical protein
MLFNMRLRKLSKRIAPNALRNSCMFLRIVRFGAYNDHKRIVPTPGKRAAWGDGKRINRNRISTTRGAGDEIICEATFVVDGSNAVDRVDQFPLGLLEPAAPRSMAQDWRVDANWPKTSHGNAGPAWRSARAGRTEWLRTPRARGHA